MAQKIYNEQMPVYLNPRIAEQVVRCNKDEYCFVIFITDKNNEERMVFL